jgi:hypothetical protein
LQRVETHDSSHLYFGQRADKSSTAATILRLLSQDLLGEIPRQKEYIVWHRFDQLFGRMDLQMCAGRVPALLDRAAIDDEIKRLRPDSEVVE